MSTNGHLTRDLVTIGCANFAPVWGDKEATLQKIEATIVEAAQQGVELLVFPERALDLGLSCEECTARSRLCPTHAGMAELIPGPASERVARLARQHDMHVIFGLSERDPHDDTVFYNAVAYVTPGGVQGSYRKLFLGQAPWVPEGLLYSPGAAIPVWPSPWGPIGILICFDFWLHPELSRIMALKGARLIVNATASFAGPAKRDLFVDTTVVRAIENVCYTASANLVGGPGRANAYGAGDLDGPLELVFGGHSTIAGPAFPRFNSIYAEGGDAEELIIATVSMKRLDRWDSVYPWRQWHNTHQREASALIAREFAAVLAPEPVDARA
jgi:predicted amidohydrolase